MQSVSAGAHQVDGSSCVWLRVRLEKSSVKMLEPGTDAACGSAQIGTGAVEAFTFFGKALCC